MSFIGRWESTSRSRTNMGHINKESERRCDTSNPFRKTLSQVCSLEYNSKRHVNL